MFHRTASRIMRCDEVQMKQAGEAPIERADDHQAGCEYIKVFHSANFFLSFVSGRLCQPQFDLREKVLL